ncbi:Hypothetical predicted protein [Marmota monax]|uniref:Uncharacterized protein n=1 Tax=Marmota monax TaxID=9995 RepID=A0A5E4CW52_MARMO|nr:Hypothetical predicted protein [Marmota monax]
MGKGVFKRRVTGSVSLRKRTCTHVGTDTDPDPDDATVYRSLSRTGGTPVHS